MPSSTRSLNERSIPWRPSMQLSHWLLMPHGALRDRPGARRARREARCAAGICTGAGRRGARCRSCSCAPGARRLDVALALARSVARPSAGRRWHREDVETGADLAEIAASRRSAAGSVAQRLGRTGRRSAFASASAPSARLRGRRAAARRGRGRACGVDPVRRLRRGHAHARGRRDRLGQDGHPDLDRGARDRARDGRGRDRPEGRRAACVSELRRAAPAAGRPFIEWTPDGDRVYNPYARGRRD